MPAGTLSDMPEGVPGDPHPTGGHISLLHHAFRELGVAVVVIDVRRRPGVIGERLGVDVLRTIHGQAGQPGRLNQERFK